MVRNNKINSYSKIQINKILNNKIQINKTIIHHKNLKCQPGSKTSLP